MGGLIVNEMRTPPLFRRFPHQPEPRVGGGLQRILQTQRKFCWLLLTLCDPRQSLRELWVPLTQAQVASPSPSGRPSFSPVSASGHSYPWTKALLRPMKCDGSEVSLWAEAVGPMPAWPCSSVCPSGWPCWVRLFSEPGPSVKAHTGQAPLWEAWLQKSGMAVGGLQAASPASS